MCSKGKVTDLQAEYVRKKGKQIEMVAPGGLRLAAFPFVSSNWDGPSMERLEEEGLGKGIDATHPQNLLHTQITPTAKNLEKLTIGTGYQEFKETLETMCSIKNNLSSSVDMDVAQSVSFKVGFEIQREESSRMKMTAHGKQIHNETVLFATENIPSSSIHFVELLEKATGEKGFQYSPGKDIPQDERDMICQDVMRNRNRGVTHYISSVDLGAKVHAVTTEHEEKTDGKTSVGSEVGGGTHGLMAKVSVDFSHETMEMSRQSEHRIYFVIDKDVQLKSEHTDIKTDQEKTIAYDVTPVWQLLEDTAWRDSVKKACKDYVDDHTPISVGPEESFLIKVGANNTRYYLMVTDNQVEGTSVKEDAHLFTLDFPESSKSVEEPDGGDKEKLQDTNTGFYLCHQASGGQQLYLTVDSENEDIVPRPVVTEEEQAKFFLAHPAGEHPEPISKWQDRTPLLLLRRHEEKTLLVFSKTVRSFLLLKRTSDEGPLVLKENEKLDDPHSYYQFSLERP